jgi:anti-sigma-K factor RskA
LTEAEIINDIRERLVAIETKLDTLTCSPEKHSLIESRVIEIEVCNKSTSHRIKALEDNNTWLWRTLFGAIIAAAVAFVFKRG